MKPKTQIASCGCEVKIAKIHLNKNHFICSVCKKVFCGKHIYLKYIDENNSSITKYAPLVCKDCYNHYHKKTLSL